MNLQYFLDILRGLIQRTSAAYSITGPVLGILSYVFSSLSLYTLAERRCIRHPWMSWVPVLNVWILGSLSDQYRYVVRGQIKSKRKALLTLRIIAALLSLVFTGILVATLVGTVVAFFAAFSDANALSYLIAPMAGIAGVGLPLAGVALACAIIEFMALYDLYCSCDPQNATLFLVLSIVLGISRPLLMFVCRDKDYGMPPRRDVPPEYTSTF